MFTEFKIGETGMNGFLQIDNNNFAHGTFDDLHEQIARITDSIQAPGAKVILDSRNCGGDHLIQLFCDERSNASCICEVDVAIVVNREIKVIIEIDTTNKPVHLCGKLHITTYAKLASYGYDCYPVGNQVSFIQVLAGVKTEKSRKIKQWGYLEVMFQKQLDEDPLGKVKHYQIFHETKPGDFAYQQNQQELIDYILLAIGR